MANVDKGALHDRKLLMTAAIVAIALTTPIGRETAEAYNGGYRSSFHGEGTHGRDFRGGGFHDRGFHGEREFRGGGFRFGGLFGGYYPGYPRYGTCYLTIYGTTTCY
jgi:hypothetical protein